MPKTLFTLASALLILCACGRNSTTTAPPPPAAPAPPAFTNSIGMKFAQVPAGSFTMGSPETELDRHNDETPHTVTMSKGFLIGIYPVTVADFKTFVAASGYLTTAETKKEEKTWKSPGFSQGPNEPVVFVSYDDAQAFCAWLSAKELRHYHPPTEAQWEYAARAGGTTPYPWGEKPDDGAGWANVADKSFKAQHPAYEGKIFNFSDSYINTAPVGTFRANAWGIYDVVGNSATWCTDWFAPYPTDAATDPTGSAQDTGYHAVRGSCFGDGPEACRAANRSAMTPDTHIALLGLRCVLDQP